jgi:putative DNA-invertase from lambdoid prophage Rac
MPAKLDSTRYWYGKLDRWGRSLIQSLQSVQELVSLGVRFIAVTQNIDTDESNPMSRFMLHIFGAFAEFEREMIRERTVSGIRAAKAKGKKLGRPKRVFRRDEVVRLRKSGQSWRSIAKQLGVPVSTVIDSSRASVLDT